MSRKKSTQAYYRRRREKPHDAIFKVFFGDAQIAKNYLLHYTPDVVHRYIDFSHFSKSDTSYVSGRFGIAFSDVVYDTRLKTGEIARLLFLFEHKSFIPTQPVYLQLLDYLLQIWEDDLKNKRPLSFVLPIVVYHGEKSWEQKNFREYFLGLPEEWQMFIPHFSYLLTDLNSIPQQVIQDKQEAEYLLNLFLALKFAHDLGLLRENWKQILSFRIDSFDADRDRILLQTLTLYMVNLHDMQPTEVQNLNKALPEEERDWLDQIPEIFGEKWKKRGLREGRAEGRVQGRAEGRAEEELEKNRNFTRKIIQKFPHWTDTEVADFVGVTLEFVERMRNELVDGE